MPHSCEHVSILTSTVWKCPCSGDAGGGGKGGTLLVATVRTSSGGKTRAGPGEVRPGKADIASNLVLVVRGQCRGTHEGCNRIFLVNSEETADCGVASWGNSQEGQHSGQCLIPPDNRDPGLKGQLEGTVTAQFELEVLGHGFRDVLCQQGQDM